MTMSLELPTPDSFPAFPFSPPYDIQVDIMRHLYASIEQKKVTIVESPTGTVSAPALARSFQLRFPLGKDTQPSMCELDVA